MTTKCASEESPPLSPMLRVPPAVVENNSKRPPPLFLPHAPNKKRRTGLVRRTHSPKTVPSPLSSPVHKKATKTTKDDDCCFEVHRVAPTVKGVAEGARILSCGEILSVPTETTYYYCTAIQARQPNEQPQEKATTTDKHEPTGVPGPLSELCHNDSKPMLLLRSPSEVDRVMTLLPKAYAISSVDIHKMPPVSFHEGRAVLHRLASRYWPGPLPLYLSSCCNSGLHHDSCPGTETTKVQLPLDCLHSYTTTTKDCLFVGMQCPSHPLTGRVLSNVQKIKKKMVVLGVAAQQEQDNSACYFTKAQDVCQHLVCCIDNNNKRTVVHVLNGEDKREAFVVPTCQYGRPSGVALWIHTRVRTVYITGNEEENNNLTSQSIQQALQQPTNQDPKRQNRNRVITAVLRKWKVVDCRSKKSES